MPKATVPDETEEKMRIEGLRAAACVVVDLIDPQDDEGRNPVPRAYRRAAAAIGEEIERRETEMRRRLWEALNGEFAPKQEER